MTGIHAKMPENNKYMSLYDFSTCVVVHSAKEFVLYSELSELSYHQLMETARIIIMLQIWY